MFDFCIDVVLVFFFFFKAKMEKYIEAKSCQGRTTVSTGKCTKESSCGSGKGWVVARR